MSRFPNLLIIGVFKAGTTSLFHYLNEHPDICGATIKETHFFSPLIYGDGDIGDFATYRSYFANCNDQKKYLLEATPSYLYGGGRLIPIFKNNFLNNHKLILILRNPAERLFSYYKFIKSKSSIPLDESFDTFIDKCVNEHNGNLGLNKGIYTNGIKEGYYGDYLKDWISSYSPKSLFICFFEDLKNPLPLMTRLSKWLEIDESFYKSFNFTIENKTVNPRFRYLHKYLKQFNRQNEKLIRRIPETKRKLRNIYFFFNDSKRGNDSLSKEDLIKLNNIYRESNKELAVILRNFGIENKPNWLN